MKCVVPWVGRTRFAVRGHRVYRERESTRAKCKAREWVENAWIGNPALEINRQPRAWATNKLSGKRRECLLQLRDDICPKVIECSYSDVSCMLFFCFVLFFFFCIVVVV